MKPDIMQGLLETICDTSMGRIKLDKITVKGINALCYFLRPFPDTLVTNVMSDICGTWDKGYLPSVSVVKSLCESLMPAGKDMAHIEEQTVSEKAYQQRKRRHRSEIDDFLKRRIEGSTLTSRQESFKALVDPYALNFFGYRDQVEEFKKDPAKHGYIASYIGLYMDALEGRLKPMGEGKGNLSINPKDMTLNDRR